MMFFFIAALLLALFLEGTVTTLPLVLIVLLCLTIYRRDAIVFPLAFLAGIVLDILTVQTLGVSGLFFIVMFFMILLYQRKYEINSYPFVAAAAFLGSVGFLLVFGRGTFFDAVINVFAGLLLFALVRFLAIKYKLQETKYTV
jgi:rod shape-determining protein MreD